MSMVVVFFMMQGANVVRNERGQKMITIKDYWIGLVAAPVFIALSAGAVVESTISNGQGK
jgi:hypothetical protein